jgi:hypothetical protein
VLGRNDYREFTRELLLRFDRSQREQREAMREMFREFDRSQREHREAMRAEHLETMAEIAVSRAEMDAHHERESRRIDDVIAENRAQRQALLAILDELRGNGGPAPAT